MTVAVALPVPFSSPRRGGVRLNGGGVRVEREASLSAVLAALAVCRRSPRPRVVESCEGRASRAEKARWARLCSMVGEHGLACSGAWGRLPDASSGVPELPHAPTR